MSLREKIESIVNSDTSELKAAVAVAENALQKVHEISEQLGLPVYISYVGGMVPDSVLSLEDDYGVGFSADTLLEELCEEEGIECPGFYSGEGSKEFEAVRELVNKLSDLVGSDYISGNDCWDSSRC